MTAKDFTIGDWVRVPRSGWWQVYRTVEYRSLDPVSAAEVKSTAVIAKRIVTDSLRKRFSAQSWHPDWVERLSAAEVAELQEFCAKNEKLVSQFDDWSPPSQDAV